MKQERKRLVRILGRLGKALGPPNPYWHPVILFAETAYALDLCLERGKNPDEVDRKSLELLLDLEDLSARFYDIFGRRSEGYKISELLSTVETLYRFLAKKEVSLDEQRQILQDKLKKLGIQATPGNLKVLVKTRDQLKKTIAGLDPPVPSLAAKVAVGKFFGMSEKVSRKKGTTLGPFGQPNVAPFRDRNFIEAVLRNVLLIEGPELANVAGQIVDLLKSGKLRAGVFPPSVPKSQNYAMRLSDIARIGTEVDRDRKGRKSCP